MEILGVIIACSTILTGCILFAYHVANTRKLLRENERQRAADKSEARSVHVPDAKEIAKYGKPPSSKEVNEFLKSLLGVFGGFFVAGKAADAKASIKNEDKPTSYEPSFLRMWHMGMLGQSYKLHRRSVEEKREFAANELTNILDVWKTLRVPGLPPFKRGVLVLCIFHFQEKRSSGLEREELNGLFCDRSSLALLFPASRCVYATLLVSDEMTAEAIINLRKISDTCFLVRAFWADDADDEVRSFFDGSHHHWKGRIRPCSAEFAHWR